MTQVIAKPRFVALLDILAFKQLRDSRGTDGLYRLFSRGVLAAIQHAAMPIFKSVERDSKTVSVPDPISQRCGFHYFSDTIIYFTDDDSLGSFFNIVLTARELLNFGFGSQVPLRGAIGHGDFIDDVTNRIFLGSSLEDAHFYSESQVWSGCILTPTASAFCEQAGYFRTFKEGCRQSDNPKARRNENLLIDYDCPFQTTDRNMPREYFTKSMVCINWTLNVFEGAAHKAFPEPNGAHPRRIVENTEQFENWAREL